jgi:hypothetical protein
VCEQLLGMKDVITLGLAKQGFNVHKCVDCDGQHYEYMHDYECMYYCDG